MAFKAIALVSLMLCCALGDKAKPCFGTGSMSGRFLPPTTTVRKQQPPIAPRSRNVPPIFGSGTLSGLFSLRKRTVQRATSNTFGSTPSLSKRLQDRGSAAGYVARSIEEGLTRWLPRLLRRLGLLDGATARGSAVGRRGNYFTYSGNNHVEFF